MTRAWTVVAACAVAGPCACAKAGSPDQPVDGPTGDASADGPMRRIDGAVIDGAIDAMPPPPTTHVVLSEVMLAPTGAEFVEIFNPTSATVDLSTYWVSDAGDYWKVPVIGYKPASTDFAGHFPAGATIDPNGVVTMVLGTAQAFKNFTNIAPDFSLADGTMVSPYSVANASLTDAGEVIALFQWDGTAPIVADVDLLEAGSASATNQLVSKSGVAQGSGQYKADANTIPLQAKAPPSGESTKRIALEGVSHEDRSDAGNGITGDDETSEDTTLTWDSSFTSPSPGTVPGTLIQSP